MAKRYARLNWQNKPSIVTPISAANLNIMDKGIDDLDLFKVDTDAIVNNGVTTVAGTVLDGRMGKTLQDQVDTINNNLANKFPIVEGDFTPGGNIIIAGEINQGFMGFVQPYEMGKINSTDDFSGSNLALALGLSGGTAFNSSVPLMKFHNKGKVLFIPLTGYRHSIPWDNIYNAGAAYETADEGFLPPAGRCGVNLAIDSADNSINCTNQRFLGEKTEATDYADSVGAVGDTLILKGWTNAANNATVTIVSITNTKIVVSGVSLVTEQGGKTSRVYNNSKKINQGKTVTIGDKTYRVYLMRGAGDNPTDSYSDADRGAAGLNNMWNELILPLHEHAKIGNWNYPAYAVDKAGAKITSDWDIGLTDENLRTHYNYGPGSYSWCQEASDLTSWRRVLRGSNGASYLGRNHSWNVGNYYSWRPVLESL